MWRYEVWVRYDGAERLVDSGETELRHEAMHKVTELVPDVEPVTAYAYGQVSRDAFAEPRPLRLVRSGGQIVGWQGV